MNFEFLNHLEEFRRRILISLAALAAATLLCFFFSGKILEFLTLPLQRYQQEALYFQTPYEAFLVHMKAALAAGAILAMPVWITQLWLFVAPGLYEKEKKTILPLILGSMALFLMGCGFAYFFVIPAGLSFLLGFSSETLKPMLMVGPYVSFFLGMILACGALFDFPILMIGLVRLGVVSVQALKDARKVVIVIILIVAAVVTPSPDPVSQLLLAFPLWGLFELSLLVCRYFEPRLPAVPRLDPPCD